jgi:hypothetical protein
MGADRARESVLLVVKKFRRIRSAPRPYKLFGFRHILTTYPNAERILKIDDDVVLTEGAFQ